MTTTDDPTAVTGNDSEPTEFTAQRGLRMPRRARRAQLLRAALAVFAQQGYHSAAMDEIADRAGVSKPVLYQHFPGKLDLYVALLDDACEQIVSATRDALASTEDNKLRVQATMDAFYLYMSNDEGAFRLVFESDLTNEPAVRERVDRVTVECAAMIADVIREDTSLPSDQAHLLAVALVGMAQVSARYWLHDGGGSPSHGIDRVTASGLISGLAWRGIRGYPRTDEH